MVRTLDATEADHGPALFANTNISAFWHSFLTALASESNRCREHLEATATPTIGVKAIVVSLIVACLVVARVRREVIHRLLDVI
jgi:hypothetical protein